MAIPDFQSVMLPLVKALGDGQERTMREVTDQLAESFHLTDQEREEVLPSGQQSIFSNRVGWAKSHLKAAGLLENPVRGRVRISNLGRSCSPRNHQRSTSSGPFSDEQSGVKAETLDDLPHKFEQSSPIVDHTILTGKRISHLQGGRRD